MIRTGKIVESQTGRLRVCFDRPEMCEHCGACTGHAHQETVTLYGEGNVGDLVQVEMPDAKVLGASALAYAVPLGGLLLGLAAGQILFQSDIAAAIGGALGLAICWLALHIFDKKMGKSSSFRPKLIAVVKEEKENGNQADTK